jgi:DNA-binding beta-propeller fold protein YncE
MRLGSLLVLVSIAAAACGASTPTPVDPNAPLVLERTIALPDVRGRIDHLAWDPARRRLFVAALGNGSVEVIDATSARQVGRISGLHEPQGVAWLEPAQELAVASADGSIKFYSGATLALVATIALGEDADNLRVDPRSGALVAGYGSGGLAIIDPVGHQVVRRLALGGHPEGFQLVGDRAYVNLPDRGEIVAVDLSTGAIARTWPTGLRLMNFPMALNPEHTLIAAAFRLPARLMIIDLSSGAVRQVLPTCGDSDDLYFHDRPRQLLVVCGSGEVDVYGATTQGYAAAGRVPTRAGARTGLWIAERERLFVAARAAEGQPAAILVYRPRP